MSNDILITEENFDQYFFDVRKHMPKKGQIMACYRSIAELVEGNEKKNLIDLLMNTDKAIAATQVMRKLFLASEDDAVKIPREITQDLLDIGYDEVLKKPYKYVLEMFFYTDPVYVPNNDPHWSTISLLNLNEFTDTVKDVTITSRIAENCNNEVEKGKCENT